MTPPPIASDDVKVSSLLILLWTVSTILLLLVQSKELNLLIIVEVYTTLLYELKETQKRWYHSFNGGVCGHNKPHLTFLVESPGYTEEMLQWYFPHGL